MDVIAIVALARNVEEEAPALAAELGLTVYETAVMLRAPMPVIVLRTDDRTKALHVLAGLRGRRHEAVAIEHAAVVPSETMFTPRTFRFEPGELVGVGHGEERRLPFGSVFAFVRANHLTHVEETVTTRQVKLSLGRAAMTGGLMATKVSTMESKRVNDERETVLYVFRTDAAPWLLRSTHIRYDGLGAELRVSTVENFEILVRTLRQVAPDTPYDTRLLAVRPLPGKVTGAGSKLVSTSSSATIDLLAHIVASSFAQASRPYR